MSLVRREIRKTQIDYLCPKCKVGRMIYQLQNTADIDFLHECDACKHNMYLPSEYPHIKEIMDLWGR